MPTQNSICICMVDCRSEISKIGDKLGYEELNILIEYILSPYQRELFRDVDKFKKTVNEITDKIKCSVPQN